MKERAFMRRTSLLLTAALLGAGGLLPPATALAQPSEQVARKMIPYAPAEVMSLAEKVADHQLNMVSDNPANYPFAKDAWVKTGWIQGVLYVGLTDLADRSENPKYKEAIFDRGRANNWELGRRPYFADDHVIGQSYLWAALNGAGVEAIGPIRARFDYVLAEPPAGSLLFGERGDPSIPDCKKRWCWADALFMAPAAWIELSRQTNDSRYAEYAKKEFASTIAYLFDQEEHLFYRDSRFFERRGPKGEKIFWSRGTGWVYAGLARIIPKLPTDDPFRKDLETLFQEMSAKLVSIQKPDGYWSPSLLADPATTRPETSGTAFFTYGMAWGIKQGLLPRKTYEPTVRKGWAALTRAVHPDGRLGYVQAVGDRPDNVSYYDNHFYGGGGFLMAATAVADLELTPGPDLTEFVQEPHPKMALSVHRGGSDGSKTYQLHDYYIVPDDHKIGDGLMAFEGLGWESSLVAYRLYLDERMAIDIFGKKTPENILHTIGRGKDDYHNMAPWGMDILKVGNTVGIGGIGRLRDGKAVQLGKSSISVSLNNKDPHESRAEIINSGLDEGQTNLVTNLSIRTGSVLTRVLAKAETTSNDPFITGLVKHPGVQVLQGNPDGTGWAYIATWGLQSLANDNLGMAIFYRVDSVASTPSDDGNSVYVIFKDPANINYAFGIAWAQDQQGITSSDEFASWLRKRCVELAIR